MFVLKPFSICRSCLRRISSSRRLLTTAIPSPPPPAPPPPPPPTGHARLTNRRLISLSGHDAPHFLQGLTTANIPSMTSASSAACPQGIYSAFLTATGRVLYDVFIYPLQTSTALPSFLLEVDSPQVEALAAYLRRFKLRAKIHIRVLDPSESSVWSVWPPRPPLPSSSSSSSSSSSPSSPFETNCLDTRAPGLGTRMILPSDQTPQGENLGPEASLESYTIRRMLHGVAEGQSEMVRETALPLESNLDYMGGIDFRKGCYVGQELTIRTRHTGVVRKRILPVMLFDRLRGEVPRSLEYRGQRELAGLVREGTVDVKGEGTGRKVGKWLGGVGDLGLALWRLEAGGGEAGGLRLDGDDGDGDDGSIGVRAFVPEWLKEKGVGLGGRGSSS